VRGCRTLVMAKKGLDEIGVNNKQGDMENLWKNTDFTSCFDMFNFF